MKKCLFILGFLFVCSVACAQDFRPPAYPLVTVDPYFSIWSFNDTLNEESTVHWTGKDNSLQGIIRVDGKSYYFLGQPIPQYREVLAMSEKSQHIWKYTFSKPDEDWASPRFNTVDWKVAAGAFSDSREDTGKWTSRDIWIRRTFYLKKNDWKHLLLKIQHDDGASVYLNGILACMAGGANHEAEIMSISKKALASLKKGKNILAIHCENTGGAGFIDAGLVRKLTSQVSLARAEQKQVSISATQTFYQFKAGDILLDVTFTSPVLPDDLDLLSRPANYISLKAHSDDGKTHEVQLYFSAAGNLAVNTPNQKVEWKRNQTENLQLMQVGTTTQNILGRKGDDVRIDWGHLYLGVPKENKSSSLIMASAASVKDFVGTGSLSLNDDKKIPRPAGVDPVTLAAAYDLGKVSSTPVNRHVILAYDQIYSIEYFHKKLKPWWKRNGMTTKEMLTKAERDYATILEKCDHFDQKLHQETSAAGGERYAKICELAYRQSVAAHKLVQGPEGNPLFFSKENFSNGSIATVDITYPSSSLFLMYNPDLLKGMMIPILYYSQRGQYDHPFAAHDVGTYPIANGMTYGEPMPVEESGNMLVLAAAITRAEGNASFPKKYWKVFSKWAHYLKGNGLDPANQLSTDDFSGHLAHNANLSIKAIMGLASYGYIANMLGMKDTGYAYIELARNYARQWMQMAADEDHYGLTFDKKNTWSQKYNLVWDKVLKLNIFPDEVAQKEIKFYLTKQNKYGLPLDSRETYTKADWIMWTATLADNPADFNAVMNPVFKYISETPSRVPFSDWYQTRNAKQVGFQARSVVGAVFMKALDEQWNK